MKKENLNVWVEFVGFDVKTRLNQLKYSAKARGLNINLDVNKYQNLINSGCHFCGDDLKNEKGYCLDRVDSTKGYSITNVVACCKICNRAKSNMDIWDFVQWLNKANTHTQAAINLVRTGIRNGHKYSEEEEMTVHAELNKDLPKMRFKYVFKKDT